MPSPEDTAKFKSLSNVRDPAGSSVLDGVSSGGVELVVHTQDEALDSKEENEDTHHPVSSGTAQAAVDVQLDDELVVVVGWARVATYVRVWWLIAHLSLL